MTGVEQGPAGEDVERTASAGAGGRTSTSSNEDGDPARSQVRGSTLLMAGRGLSVGLNFLTQVLTVRYLAKADYGALAYALAMASFFAQLSRFGMDKAVSRFAAIEEERREYARMFGTLLFAGGLVVACGTSLAIGIIGLGGSMGSAVVRDRLSLDLLLILIALAPIDGLDYVLQSVFATFSKPRLIVFRKYIVGPLLKLLAIVGVMIAAADVYALAIARLGASALGLAIAASLLRRVLRERDLLAHLDWRRVQVRAKEILGYSLPMVGSDAVLLLRGALVVFFLEHLHGSVSVADFRSVLPVARLNNVALDSFAFLFVPAVARLTASRAAGSLNDMYWRSATWVTVLSLPVFLVTFALARPVTVLLFGDQYAGAAPVLALLSAGAFVHASLAMSGLVLKAAGRVGNVLLVDASALAIELLLILALIPRLGAVGGAAAYAITATAHAVTYQLVLVRKMEVSLLPTGFGRVYATMALVVGTTLLVDAWFAPGVLVGFATVGALWLWLVVRVADQLEVARTFPELLRVPLLGPILRRASARARGGVRPSGRAAELTETLRTPPASLRGELGAPPHRARLLRTRERPGATLLEFDLRGADASLRLLVKTTDADPSVTHELRARGGDFPRMGRREHPATIIDGERTTLRAVEDRLAELGDTRFEPVRVFDLPSEPGTVAMERLSYPTLRRLVHRACLVPWARPGREVLTASANAGAWLRAFQSLPRLEHTESRHADRAAFIDAVDEFAAYLVESGAERSFVLEARRRTVSGAEALLARDPPCALGHGDYAPRNVLVAPGGRVAVIDTPGRWWHPTYLDVGYFLADVGTSAPRVLTGGLLPGERFLNEMEGAFLEGYFGREVVAPGEVRLFEILALLAKWASAVHTSRSPATGTGAMGRMLARAKCRLVRRRLEAALDALGDKDGRKSRTAKLGLPSTAIGTS